MGRTCWRRLQLTTTKYIAKNVGRFQIALRPVEYSRRHSKIVTLMLEIVIYIYVAKIFHRRRADNCRTAQRFRFRICWTGKLSPRNIPVISLQSSILLLFHAAMQQLLLMAPPSRPPSKLGAPAKA
jgi:hypothetical protein